MRILQLSSPSGKPTPKSTECITIRPAPKLVPTVGRIRVVLLSACGFSVVVDFVFRSVMTQLCTLYDSGAKLFAYLDDWYLWIKSQYLLQSLSSLQPPDQSTFLYSRPRHKHGKVFARTLFHLNSKTRSHSPSAAWVDICKSMETLSQACCSG